MKRCPACDAMLDESFVFCPEDGSGLQSSDPVCERESGSTGPFEANRDLKPLREPDATLVLYCSVCGSEFPPTFEVCPTHQVPLITSGLVVTNEVDSPQPEARQEPPPEIDIQARPEDASAEPEEPPTAPISTRPEERTGFSTSSADFLPEAAMEGELTATGRSSFSIAAAAIAGLLILAAIVAIISVATSFSRRPALRASISPAAIQHDPQPEVSVPTPAEALDYSEPAPIMEPTRTAIAKPPQVQPELTSANRIRSATWAQRRNDDLIQQPVIRPQSRPRPVAEPEQRFSVGSGPARTNLVSHLIRVEADRRSNGVHYELTFSLANESGRQSYLRNLTVVTRSSRGISRAQTLPFSHRLGPNGSLTFKIGVDMPGRSFEELQGHVSLLASGYDSVGGAVQTRFAAPLRP